MISTERLCAVPDGLDLRDAAAVLHDGPTALAAHWAARGPT